MRIIDDIEEAFIEAILIFSDFFTFLFYLIINIIILSPYMAFKKSFLKHNAIKEKEDE